MALNLILNSGIKNHLGLFRPDGQLEVEKTLAFVGLKLKQAEAIFQPRAVKRAAGEISPRLKKRLAELAGFLDFLAETLDGDKEKVKFWLITPNAHFGGSSPMDLIRVRRYKAVYRFILAAKTRVDAHESDS